MDTLRQLMDFSSFWTVWFWIAHVVAWSMASHFAMGVPYDMVIQAGREKTEDGPFARATEMLAQAQVFRINFFAEHYGVALTAATAFLLSVLATLGFWSEVELARAILSILGPLVLIYLLSIRAARKARRLGLTGAALRRLIARQRFWNQLIGVLALSLAMALAVWEALKGVSPIWL